MICLTWLRLAIKHAYQTRKVYYVCDSFADRELPFLYVNTLPFFTNLRGRWLWCLKKEEARKVRPSVVKGPNIFSQSYYRLNLLGNDLNQSITSASFYAP